MGFKIVEMYQNRTETGLRVLPGLRRSDIEGAEARISCAGFRMVGYDLGQVHSYPKPYTLT